MSNHGEASPGSKQICQLIYERLAERIPNLKRSEAENWCTLYQSGRKRFAYISHRKRSSDILIWCAGRVEDLLSNAELEVIPRDEIRSGWEERFPARFFVQSEHDIEPACDLLYRVSYPAS